MNPIKNRPIALSALFLIAGILLSWNGFENKLPIFAIILIGIGLLLAASLSCIFLLKIKTVYVYLACIALIVGFLITNGQIHRYSDAPAIEGALQGRICAYPVVSQTQTMIIVDQCEIGGEKLRPDVKVRIYYAGKAQVSYGDTLAATVKLKPASPPRNPGAADARINLWSKNMMYSGSTREIRVTTQRKSLLGGLLVWRASMEQTMRHIFDTDTYGALKGMLFGDTSEMDEQLIDSFRITGLSHILAVSGLHVGLVAGAVQFVLAKLKVNKQINAALLVMLLFAYCVITGFSPSVLRASMMIFISSIGNYIGERNDTLTTLSVSAIILLVHNPLLLLTLSFILSFGAVLGIIAFYQPMTAFYAKALRFSKLQKAFYDETTDSAEIADSHPADKQTKNSLSAFKSKKLNWQGMMLKIMKGIIAGAAVSTAAQLGILPAQLYFFGTVPTLSLFVNVVVAPLTTVSVVGGFIAVILGSIYPVLAMPIAGLCKAAVKLTACIASFATKIPYATLNIGAVHIVFAVMIIVALFMFSKWQLNGNNEKKRKIILGACAAMMCFTYLVGLYVNRGMMAVFLDVGQGDAAYITSGKTKILIDGGNRQNNIDYGKNVVVPFLTKQGVTQLDAIIISHPHADHVGGLLAVCQNIKVKTLVVGDDHEADEQYAELMNDVAHEEIQVVRVKADDLIKIGDLQVDIFGPRETNIDANEASLIMNVSYRGIKIMFTGDAGFPEENGVLEYIQKAHILKVAHHGSKNSSSQAFLERVAPSLAVISVGEGNTYGHPTEQTLMRLKDVGADIIRTDQSGAVILKVNEKGIHVHKMIN